MQYADPLALFDPAKPFHSLVLNYLALLVGFRKLFYRGSGLLFRPEVAATVADGLDPLRAWTIDVTARGMLDARDPRWLGPETLRYVDEFDRAKIMENRADLGMWLHYAWADLDTSIVIPSRETGEEMAVRIDDIARRVPQGGTMLHEYMVRASGVLLVLAREATKTLGLETPEWEFLRHCRNGIAHGGCFHFKGKEPRLPASWRRNVITRPMQDTPVFQLSGPAGLLDAYDPILLLWDLEKATPEIPATRLA